MELSSTARELLLEERQRADNAQASLERLARAKDFVLVIVLIAITVAVATLIASLSGDITIPLHGHLT